MGGLITEIIEGGPLVRGYLIFQPYAMISVMTKDLEYIVSTNTGNE